MRGLADLYYLQCRAKAYQNTAYLLTSKWHEDLCDCWQCQAIKQWDNLNWFQQTLAKFAYYFGFGDQEVGQ